ncbi:MAG: hypothetical protein U0T84_11895 [Chitinophagales bacterium]
MEEVYDMEKKEARFDAAVREQFAEYQPPVPNALWNRISMELEQDPVSTVAVSSPAAVRSWRPWAVAASVALIIGLGYHANAPTAETQVAVRQAQPTQINSAPVTNTTLSATNPVVAVEPAQQTAFKAARLNQAVSKPMEVVNPVRDAEASTTVAVEESAQPATQELTAEVEPQLGDQHVEVEMTNIPMYALNFLSPNKSLNDEITVLHPATGKTKKQKNKGNTVVVLGKKYDHQPDIKYQMPYRF